MEGKDSDTGGDKDGRAYDLLGWSCIVMVEVDSIRVTSTTYSSGWIEFPDST